MNKDDVTDDDANLAATAAELADQIRRTLAAIDAGELTASTATSYRLQGALSALDALLGRPSTLLADLDPPRST